MQAQTQPLNPQIQAIGIVSELIKREQTVPGSFEKTRPTAYPDLSSVELLTSLEVFLAHESTKIPLVASHGTTIACSSCGRLNAPAFYLKRSHGRYVVLCFDNGEGCWEHSSNSNCSYTDQHAAQCVDLAEWIVTYGVDMLKERHVCALHCRQSCGSCGCRRYRPPGRRLGARGQS